MGVSLVERKVQRRLQDHLHPGERIQVAGTAQVPMKVRTALKQSGKGLAVGIPLALFTGLGIAFFPKVIMFALTEGRLLFAADDVVSVRRSETEILLGRSRAMDGPLNSTMSLRFADGEGIELVIGPIVARKMREVLRVQGEA